MIQLASRVWFYYHFISAMFVTEVGYQRLQIDRLSFIKGVLAVLYGIWLVYSGGMMF